MLRTVSTLVKPGACNENRNAAYCPLAVPSKGMAMPINCCKHQKETP
jgi:hypothetical protein